MVEKPAANAPLTLSKDEMRDLGYRAVDLLVEHFSSIPERSPVATANRAEMDALLMEPVPQRSMQAGDVLDEVTEKVFPQLRFADPSPLFFLRAEPEQLCGGARRFSGVRVQCVCRRLGYPLRRRWKSNWLRSTGY